MHSSITLQLFGASLDVYYTVHIIGSPLKQQWWGPSSIKKGGRKGERGLRNCKLSKNVSLTKKQPQQEASLE